MPFEDLSKTELIKVLELIEQAGKCFHKKDLRDLILKANDVLEAEWSVCGLVKSCGAPEVTDCVNGNYPEQWTARYMDEKLYLSDPVVKYISNFTLPRNWNEIFKACGGKSERRFLKEAFDFNLRFGITGGVYVPELESVATFSFAARNDTFNKHHVRIMDILVLHFNKALVRSVESSLAVRPLVPDEAGEFKGFSS